MGRRREKGLVYRLKSNHDVEYGLKLSKDENGNVYKAECKIEKSKSRSHLTNLCLEGILLAKQQDTLQSLKRK